MSIKKILNVFWSKHIFLEEFLTTGQLMMISTYMLVLVDVLLIIYVKSHCNNCEDDSLVAQYV